MISKNEIENDLSDSEYEFDDKFEKKIFPVYNENNFYITKEIIQSILQKGNINKEINDLELWQQAFIHKSYCKNNDFKKNEKFFGNIDAISLNDDKYKHIMPLQDDSNEVLEWLGDGIIQSVSAIYLYKRYNNQREGFLTKIRSKLVKTESLAKLALSLNFDKYLIVSKHIEIICNGRKNARILEDSFEAFIGSMFNYFGSKNESEGFNICSTFIINMIEQNIDITDLIMNDDNYKDQLMRYYQKMYGGKFPKYEQKTIITLLNENGIANKKFHMIVRDNDNIIIGEGIARSKKEAEQKAAKAGLMHFGISNGF
jgi:ribonuclease-3